MLRKTFTYILIICHINTSMFLPQISERDVYDASGKQWDDINTLTEYIDQVVLNNKDTSPEDEDDDSGQNFRLVKSFDFFYQPARPPVTGETRTASDKPVFYGDIHAKVLAPVYDIIGPPPKA